jgi:hypothetical protein
MGTVRSSLFYRSGVGGKVAIEDMGLSTGQRLFVHAGTGTNDASHGFTPDKPLASLAYAFSSDRLNANKGDIVYIMPGHTEAIIAATTLVMDIAGVRVIGLGQGRLKPQFSITTANTATWSITAANCSIENVDIISNFLNIAAAMTIDALATGTTLKDVRMFDTSVVLGALIGISVGAAASDLTIENFKYHGLALTAPATNAILCAGAADRLTIKNAFIFGDFSDGCVVATAAASAQVNFKNVILCNLSETGKGINLHASTTGFGDEVLAYLEDQTGNEKAITGAALFMTDRVKQTNVVTASPYLCIAADS